MEDIKTSSKFLEGILVNSTNEPLRCAFAGMIRSEITLSDYDGMPLYKALIMSTDKYEEAGPVKKWLMKSLGPWWEGGVIEATIKSIVSENLTLEYDSWTEGPVNIMGTEFSMQMHISDIRDAERQVCVCKMVEASTRGAQGPIYMLLKGTEYTLDLIFTKGSDE